MADELPAEAWYHTAIGRDKMKCGFCRVDWPCIAVLRFRPDLAEKYSREATDG